MGFAFCLRPSSLQLLLLNIMVQHIKMNLHYPLYILLNYSIINSQTITTADYKDMLILKNFWSLNIIYGYTKTEAPEQIPTHKCIQKRIVFNQTTMISIFIFYILYSIFYILYSISNVDIFLDSMCWCSGCWEMLNSNSRHF